MDLPLLRYALEFSDIGLRIQLSFAVLSICFIVFWIFQKAFPNVLFGEDSEFAGYIYNAMGVVFSLVFAFVTVLVWQNYNMVSDAIAKEASTLNNMYRLFSAFPPETEKKGRDALRAYTKTVINEEWPLLSKDQYSIKAYQELLKVDDIVIHLQPQNQSQSNVHLQLLRLASEANELRRSRVYNAHFALASPAWLGLISSSLIFLFFACLFKMNSVRTHLILIFFLGLTIVGVLYFMVIYIHPFLGPMALGPGPIENLLKIAWVY
jgi:hypothetical protein